MSLLSTLEFGWENKELLTFSNLEIMIKIIFMGVIARSWLQFFRNKQLSLRRRNEVLDTGDRNKWLTRLTLLENELQNLKNIQDSNEMNNFSNKLTIIEASLRDLNQENVVKLNSFSERLGVIEDTWQIFNDETEEFGRVKKEISRENKANKVENLDLGNISEVSKTNEKGEGPESFKEDYLRKVVNFDYERINLWIGKFDNPSIFNLLNFIKSINYVIYHIDKTDNCKVEEICNIVRHKVVGEASEFISSVPQDLNIIKNMLVLRYGTQRTIGTISCDLKKIYQGSEKIDSYYEKVRILMVELILKKIVKAESKEIGAQLENTARELALTAFVSGLNSDLYYAVQSQEPKTLEEAYEMAKIRVNLVGESQVVTYQELNELKMEISNTLEKCVNKMDSKKFGNEKEQVRVEEKYPRNSSYIRNYDSKKWLRRNQVNDNCFPQNSQSKNMIYVNKGKNFDYPTDRHTKWRVEKKYAEATPWVQKYDGNKVGTCNREFNSNFAQNNQRVLMSYIKNNEPFTYSKGRRD